MLLVRFSSPETETIHSSLFPKWGIISNCLPLCLSASNETDQSQLSKYIYVQVRFEERIAVRKLSVIFQRQSAKFHHSLKPACSHKGRTIGKVCGNSRNSCDFEALLLFHCYGTEFQRKLALLANLYSFIIYLYHLSYYYWIFINRGRCTFVYVWRKHDRRHSFH